MKFGIPGHKCHKCFGSGSIGPGTKVNGLVDLFKPMGSQICSECKGIGYISEHTIDVPDYLAGMLKGIR